MNRPTDIQVVARAADFAARRHTHQRRKGEAAEPYFNHLAHVAAVLADAGADANLVAAGYLHDTIEDQEVTHAELVEAFDLDVADLVAHVTDDKRPAQGPPKAPSGGACAAPAASGADAQDGRQDQQPVGTARQPAGGLVSAAAH